MAQTMWNRDVVTQWLVVLLAFIAPLSTAGVNIVAGMILLALVASGDYKAKLSRLSGNAAALSVLAYVFIQLVGLVWVEGKPVDGHKFYLLLLVPLIACSLQKETIPKVCMAFVAAMGIAEAVSYYKIITLWSQHGGGGASGYTAFMSSISYAPFLVFALSVVLVSFLEQRVSGYKRLILVVLMCLMALNLFTTGGRAGQLSFGFVLLAIMGYYFRQRLGILLAVVLSLPLLYGGMYLFNPAFKSRIDAVVSDVRQFKANPNTSVGLRMNFAYNSLQLFKERPLMGYGTGSFAREYDRINNQLTPQALTTKNPHNMYALSLVQQGVLGFVTLCGMFASQVYLFWRSHNASYRVLMLALPLLYALICLSDSYLWGVHTQALFALFAGTLFSYENINQSCTQV